MKPEVRLLLLKGTVAAHERHLSDGRTVHVQEHDSGRQTMIPAGWEQHYSSPAMNSWRRPFPAGARARKKHAEVHHFRHDDSAQSIGEHGYVQKHDNLQDAFDTLERTTFRKPDSGR